MTRLTQLEVETLQKQHPDLMADYLDHMTQIGWGQQENGRMLYSGPAHPADVYGESFDDSTLLLLGDDGCGYCFAFDPATLAYGELNDRGEWIPWLDRSFTEYLA